MDTTPKEINGTENNSHHAGITAHAFDRCLQHEVPSWVVDALRARPFMAQRKEAEGRISYFRIVRVGGGRFWVGVERDDVLITVIPVGFGSSSRRWFRNRILNFEVIYKQIKLMPILRGPKAPKAAKPEAVSAQSPRPGWGELNSELSSLWELQA
jgi:hypothetical protein